MMYTERAGEGGGGVAQGLGGWLCAPPKRSPVGHGSKKMPSPARRAPGALPLPL